MAGLGRRTFAAGEVLTASNVMGYLQDQAVMNFAGTAARGSAIGTATEGMVSYLADLNQVQVYDGSTWQKVYPAVPVTGQIMQVVTATYTTETTTTSSSFVTAGLTATITPTSATNKILVLTSATMSHNDERDVSIATLFRGTVAGTNLGNGVNGMAAIRNAITGASNTRSTFGLNYLDSPATTSATTYTLGFRTTAIQAKIQVGSATSVMTLLEVVA